MKAFHSALGDCCFHPAGWEVMPSGIVITRMPVWDTRYDIAARLGHGPAAEFLSDLGFRLPTKAEMDELHSLSVYVPPFTMPTTQQLAENNIVRTEKAVNRYRTANMMGLEWCKAHDRAVFEMLDEAGWDGHSAVANFGKHWVQPVGAIYGWWEPDGTRIQNLSLFHEGEPSYVDYATNFHAAFEPATAA